MRMLSWRALPSSHFGLGASFPETCLGSAISRLLLISPLVLIPACNREKRPDFVFSSNGLTQQQYARAEAECRPEAKKAALLATNSVTAGDTWERIFTLCLQSKGAKYLGTTDGFPELKKNAS